MHVDCHSACWLGLQKLKYPYFCNPSDNVFLFDGVEMNARKWLRSGVTAKLYIKPVNTWNY
jgi:hypothetical protein